MFSFFGLTFHLYGLIVGAAIAVGLTLVEKKAQAVHLSEKTFWSLVLWMLGGGFLGARLWHVVTDFHLYQSQLVDTVKVWNGGLSILGGVVGGIFGLWLWQKRNPNIVSFGEVLDLAIFGLPIGQAIGRWGNYVNQELYGLPTNLPWAITIDPEFRASGFEAYANFHPLFAYEMMATGLFGIWVWWYQSKAQFKIGSGFYFWLYITYYSFVRFWLDVIRIEKTLIPGLPIGINQVVLLIIFSLGLLMIYKKNIKNRLGL